MTKQHSDATLMSATAKLMEALTDEEIVRDAGDAESLLDGLKAISVDLSDTVILGSAVEMAVVLAEKGKLADLGETLSYVRKYCSLLSNIQSGRAGILRERSLQGPREMEFPVPEISRVAQRRPESVGAASQPRTADIEASRPAPAQPATMRMSTPDEIKVEKRKEIHQPDVALHRREPAGQSGATEEQIAARRKPDANGHLTPAVPVETSVTADYILCLEDGKELQMMKRWLRSHYGLTPDEYRQRWGLPYDYPMVAPSYSRSKSLFARQQGLGKHARTAEEEEMMATAD